MQPTGAGKEDHMTGSPLAIEFLRREYELAREEISKSIFIQYDVIKIGTLFLGSLLVAVPTVFSALGGSNTLFLALLFLALAFIATGFVFAMGAGEIRIMRAAAFCHRALDILEGKQPLTWDRFVREFNISLYQRRNPWRFKERLFLAMPFVIITLLADIGAAICLWIWVARAAGEMTDWWLRGAVAAALVIQGLLFWWPAVLSRELERTFNEYCDTDTQAAKEG
jgi:hypothetical protein